MGRRGQIRTAATFTVAAGLVVALVVRTGGVDLLDPLVASGTAAVEPTLVEPRHPSALLSSPLPATTIRLRAVAEWPSDGVSTYTSTRDLGVSVGSVGGLYPGHRVGLGVRYLNPHSFPIAVVKVGVRAEGTQGCTARQLMRPRAPRPRIPSRSSITSVIKMGMRESAPDACQGVRFAVRVRVTAVRL